jgi:staphylococcal nuclease domain-containing protein 1
MLQIIQPNRDRLSCLAAHAWPRDPLDLHRPLFVSSLCSVGIVKGVLSGDTVILQGTAPRPGAPAPELQLSLAHLSAPRISRHSDQRDEPFGWPSREFLRKALVGRQVRFKVDYKVEKIGRSFATLWLTDGSLGPESVNVAVARNGWAKVNPSNGPTKSDVS